MNIVEILNSKKPTILAKTEVEKIVSSQLKSFSTIKKLFYEKSGIEIGGTSKKFKANSYL